MRNGTFALPAHFGPNAYISHLFLTNSTDDFVIPNAEFRELGSFSTFETNLEKCYSETVTNRKCTSPLGYSDRLIKYEQQVYIAGEFCDFVATVSPYSYTFMGMKIQNIACGEDFSYVCTGFGGIANTAAGAYVGPGIEAMCKPSYDRLIAACGEDGGIKKSRFSKRARVLKFSVLLILRKASHAPAWEERLAKFIGAMVNAILVAGSLDSIARALWFPF